MTSPAWTLRPARPDDRVFLLRLKEAAMRCYVEQVWGWDDAEQAAFLDEGFVPERWQIIQVQGQDAGVLVVEEDAEQLYLAEIELLPVWQGRGIGTAAIGSLMERALVAGKPITLRVLHVNKRARALYERLGFQPYKEIETHTYLSWEKR
jgi:ribosomal protein S18 acetylase RimI-like enzyme